MGTHTVVEDSSIEYCVMLECCHICQIERLEDSLVGRGVKLEKGRVRSRAARVFLGDDARMGL